MKLLILAHNPSGYATRRLAEAAVQRGHTVEMARPLDCVVRLNGRFTTITHAHHDLTQFDVALLRTVGQSYMGHEISVPLESYLATQLALAGVRCLNTPAAKQIASDKFHTLQLLNHAGLPIPDSWLVGGLERMRETAVNDLPLPAVIKLPRGSWGAGVIKVETAEAALSTHHLLSSLSKIATVQAFVAAANNQDIRAFVVGDKVVAAMRRTAPAGDFRANIHLGGTAVAVTLPPATQAIAVAAAQTVGLEVAGVDLLETASGPLVIEVNSTPGLEEIEATTGVDVAGAVIGYLG
ncbi:MAG: RimK family alpha-L-glutamate ligase [Chloroflexota bacterium]